MMPELIRPTSRVERREWGSGHRYKLDGEWVQGVTTILGNALPKPALMKWYAAQAGIYAFKNHAWLARMTPEEREEKYLGAPESVRDEAGSRGTALHEAMVPLLQYKAVEGLSEEVHALALSGKAFLDDWGIRPLIFETVVWSSEPRYAGTLDLVCTADRYPGRVFLVDWKTNKKGIWPEVALQLSAYANAESYVGTDGYDYPMADLGITDLLALHISEEGYRVQRCDFSPSTFELFKIAAALSSRTSPASMRSLLLEGGIEDAEA